MNHKSSHYTYVSKLTCSGSAMIRNCSAAEASPPPTNNSLQDQPEKPPPWKLSGPITNELFGIWMLPWILFSTALSYEQIRKLRKTATGPGRGISRIWNIVPEYDSEALQKYFKRTSMVASPVCFAAELTAIITMVALWDNVKKAKKTSFEEYYYAHAREDNQQKEWMKDIYSAPAGMQALSLTYWLGASGLAQAMAGNDKKIGEISYNLFTGSIEDLSKIIDHQAQLVTTIKAKGAGHPDVLQIAKTIQTEYDKISQLRAHLNNTTKSVSSVIKDNSLTHKKAMDEINELLKFQADTVERLKNGATDSVAYWLQKYIDQGASESKNKRKQIATVFKNRIDEYAQWMAFRPQDSAARYKAAKFMRLASFGTAEDVWQNAAILYHACEKSPATAKSLPDYNKVMDLWAERYPERAAENYSTHGFRYPPKLIG